MKANLLDYYNMKIINLYSSIIPNCFATENTKLQDIDLYDNFCKQLYKLLLIKISHWASTDYSNESMKIFDEAHEQKSSIMDSVANNDKGNLIVEAPTGTGKSQIISLLFYLIVIKVLMRP